MKVDPVSVTVRDNPAKSRYEIRAGDALAGFTEYKLTSGQIAFLHTETDPAFSGRGLAKQLVAATLDDVYNRDLAVLPFCPYVKKFISQNHEYVDLVPADQRRRFNLAQ